MESDDETEEDEEEDSYTRDEDPGVVDWTKELEEVNDDDEDEDENEEQVNSQRESLTERPMLPPYQGWTIELIVGIQDVSRSCIPALIVT